MKKPPDPLHRYKKKLKKLRAELVKAQETQLRYVSDHIPNTLKFDCDKCGRHITVSFHLSSVTGI